jgi:phosphoribosylglycinamide formyltransferase-1
MKIGILISGRGSNMVALVDAVKGGWVSNAEVAVVISDKADAAGLAKAKERGIETLVIERGQRTRAEHDGEIAAALKERGVELVCLAGYMRLLSPEFIASYRGRILNIHPSLLPSFPGLHAQRQALEHGVKFTGCTVHFVDEDLDHGAIIAQSIVRIHDDDTEESLSERILAEEHKLYRQALNVVVNGQYILDGRCVFSYLDKKIGAMPNTVST